MGNERDVFEWRRFGHWDTSAAKARFAAFVLWEMSHAAQSQDFAAACNHKGGDAGHGLLEAFKRESAIALELVVKAVIASKMRARSADPAREGIPATHDLPRLWSEAGLPRLSWEDKYRLLLAKQTLMWSGRYSTPRSVKAWEDESRDFDALEDLPAEPGRFVVRTRTSFGWTDFDRLYQIARGFIQ
jgi:hypothetical protein